MVEGAAAGRLVGRERELAALAGELMRPGSRGALIVGEGGVGKTALSNALLTQLEGRLSIFRVHASSALTNIPYGALAPLLPTLADSDADSPLGVMRALLEQLDLDREALDALPRTLVVVDDAHLLDEPGADLLSQLASSGRIRLLLLARSIQQLPAGLPAQVWDGLLARFRLQPLTPHQVHEVCERVLGGPLLYTSGIELAALSGGNPMFVLALVEEGQRAGGLRNHNGVWLMEQRTLPSEGRLGDLLRAQLAGLTPLEREAFELVVLAEPLPLTAAFRMGLHRAVDVLVEAELVTLTEDTPRLLCPRYPLHAEVVRRMVPAARSTRLRRGLLAAAPETATGRQQTLRQVSWALDCGEEVAPAQLLRAARLANNEFQSDLAARAAAGVDDPALLIPARVEKARASLQEGETVRALELLGDAVEQATDHLTLRNAVIAEATIRLPGQESSSQLVKLCGRWAAAIDRLEPNSRSSDTASARRGAKLLDCLARLNAPAVSALEPELEVLLAEARTAGDSESVLIAQVILADLHVLSGRPETALQPAREAFLAVQGNDGRFRSYYLFILHRYLAVLLWLDRWEELEGVLEQDGTLALRGQLQLGGTADFCLAVRSARQGDSAGALKRLRVALAGLRRRDPEGLLTLALGFAAIQAAQQEEAECAAEVAALLAAGPPRGPLQYRLICRGYVAAARALSAGDRDLSGLHAAADEASAAEQTAAEFDLRSMAVRLGDLSNIGTLLKLAEECEGPQAVQMRRFARAVVDQDIDELLRMVPEDHPPRPFTGVERQCLEEALRLARRSGDRTLSHRIQRRIARGTPSPRTGVSSTLTRRERDVASLAAQGFRNAEIAARLLLSVRTVEGHIYRTFEKLGISRREDLREALDRLESGTGAGEARRS